MDRRLLLLGATGLTAGLAAPAIVQAQGAYPTRPLRMIVPWPPGQATDLMARVTASKIAESWGQPIVPENRAGAGGMIGTDLVAKAAPDGYTILAASTGPFTTAPLVQRTPYDVTKDFAPVAQIGISPYVLIVRKDFPAQTAAEFLARVRAEPGKYTYATSGTGAAAHLINYDAGAFGGYMVPAATPSPIIERLAAETQKALASNDVRARLAQIGFQPQFRNTADFTTFLARHREEFR
jgi:tripartite-type tricarboxylate transporter receptor subunit TctC